MDLNQNTLVFRLESDNQMEDIKVAGEIKNFIADLSGISVDVAENIKEKFVIFDKSISKMKGSFVIVCAFSFDDNLTIVPTLQEAYDYIEMEEIERQLEL